MRLAVVIPTLDEEHGLLDRLAEARREADATVVSDGGSSDRTVAIARDAGALLVAGEASRGAQLNRGAERARLAGADVFLFLHADTELPPGTGAAVRAAMAAGAVGGGFLVGYREPGLVRAAPLLVNLRTRLFHLPLGDQAQFASAAAFARLGGFRDWPILEDLDFARRLRRAGKTVVPPLAVFPSARRFAREGLLRSVVRNWLIFGLYCCGVSPHRLARFYRQVR